MERIGIRIREQRTKLGWTVQKLATLAELDRGFMSKIETGAARGSWDTYLKISKALGVPLDSLLANGSNVEIASLGVRRVPVLDYVQAGNWRASIGPPQDTDVRETIFTEIDTPPSIFGLRIRGNSMEPEFRDGDLIVIAPTILPKPGSYVLATDERGEATFRQFRDAGVNERGQQVFELHPLNPIYGVTRSDRQKVTIVGTMIEHRRFFSA